MRTVTGIADVDLRECVCGRVEDIQVRSLLVNQSVVFPLGTSAKVIDIKGGGGGREIGGRVAAHVFPLGVRGIKTPFFFVVRKEIEAFCHPAGVQGVAV
jgi:hypothetical protein